MKDQFYGSKKIKDILEGPESYLKEIVFEDGSTELVHQEVLVAGVTDAPVDATVERHNRCLPIVKAILETLLRYNVHIDELDFISQRMVLSINESMKRSNEILWGQTEEQRTMMNVHDILISAEKIVSPFVPGEDKK